MEKNNGRYVLIKEWHESVRILQHAHYEEADRLERRNLLLGIPVIILTTIAGTSAFTTLTGSPDTRVQILTGLLSVIAAVLAGLQTFMRYSERSGKHRTAAAKYGMLRREIEPLVFDAEDKHHTEEFIESFRKRWDSLDQESPALPTEVYDRVKKEIRAKSAR